MLTGTGQQSILKMQQLRAKPLYLTWGSQNKQPVVIRDNAALIPI